MTPENIKMTLKAVKMRDFTDFYYLGYCRILRNSHCINMLYKQNDVGTHNRTLWAKHRSGSHYCRHSSV